MYSVAQKLARDVLPSFKQLGIRHNTSNNRFLSALLEESQSLQNHLGLTLLQNSLQCNFKDHCSAWVISFSLRAAEMQLFQRCTSSCAEDHQGPSQVALYY